MSAHVGHLLPDTFDKFLQELGIPTRQLKSTTTDVEQAMKKAHTIKMFKMYWKAVRYGGDHPNEPEKCEDNDNESEMSEDVGNPSSLRQQLAWMARSDTDSSETDAMTSHESDLLYLESDKEYDDDDVPLEITRGERLLQIAQEGEGVDRLEKESRQEHARMTQSGTDSPMTDDDTTSSESDI